MPVNKTKPEIETGAFYTSRADGVVVNVAARPRSSRAGIDSVAGGALKVRIRSAPVDGKANRELVETLSDAFDIPKKDVVFVQGETSKTKRILLKGVAESRLLEVCGGA